MAQITTQKTKTKNKKYHIITYGCQMNWSDSERFAGALECLNYEKASSLEDADLIVINACSVRQSAVDRVWGQTKKILELKKKKNVKAILTGCVLEQDKTKFKERFDVIMKITDIPKLPEILGEEDKIKLFQDQISQYSYLNVKPKYGNNFRAYVPISTGCNYFCTYCVIPYTRGLEKVRPVDEIMSEVEELVKNGYKDIWLLGENVNSYQYKNVNFAKLLRKINSLKGKFWIHFVSPNPKDFTDEQIDTIAKCKKIGKYVNLPLQSGNPEVLKRMRRRYDIKKYIYIAKTLRKKVPELCLSTDVIVGFCGETRKEFEDTKKMFELIKYDMAYISEYSERKGTVAAKIYKDNVSHREKERRKKILNKILEKTALYRNKKYVGKVMEAIPDEYKDGYLVGKLHNWKTVKFKAGVNWQRMIGEFVKVRITEALPWGLKAEVVIK